MSALRQRQAVRPIAALGVALSITILSLAWASKAESYARFGSYVFPKVKYGGSTSIIVPQLLPITSDEFVLYRNLNETSPDLFAMMQGGLYRSGSGVNLRNCASSPTDWSRFVEYWPIDYGPTLTTVCQLYGTVTPGDRVRVDLFPVSGINPSNGLAPWQLQFDNTAAGTYKVNYDSAFPGIGGELVSVDTTFGTTTGGSFGTPTGWYYYGAYNEGSATAVGTGDPTAVPPNLPIWTLAPSTNWYIPPLPTPFKVEHNA